MGLLLSGGLNDGTYGLMLIKERGGLALVQDPEEAEAPSLVQSALDNVAVDHVLRGAEIASALTRLIHEPARNLMKPAEPFIDPSESENMGLPRRPPGQLAPLVCPECGGSLWENHHENLIRFECHEGHALTAESLLSEQSDAVEAALWSALRALDENAELFRRMSGNALKMGRLEAGRAYEENAREAGERADLIRRLLLRKKAS